MLRKGTRIKQVVAGLMPTEHILTDVPPDNAYWGVMVHDYKMPIGHKDIFERKMQADRRT